jgi:hypothetical protein
LLIAVALALGAVVGDPAMANGGTSDAPYYFFNQSGIAREQAVADLAECSELAGAAQPLGSDTYAYTAGVIAAGVTGFLQGMERGQQRRNMVGAAFRKCMAIKGYQRYAMSKDEAKAMFAGSWEDGRKRLADAAVASVGDHQRIDP